jgi:DNA (cytosine-5)-methyltransferase 1
MVRAIDLFCGAGGSSFGAQAAGVTMVGAVDAWDIATTTYIDNFPSAKRNVVTRRLTDRSSADLFDRIGRVDLLLASPECTNHSVAKGAAPRCEESQRSGWYIRKFLEDLEPRWIVLENVTGMRRWGGFDKLLDMLQKRHGYKLRIQTLDAADFGVPQSRRRLFIVGDRKKEPRAIEIPGTRQIPVRRILDPVTRWPANPVFNGKRAEATLERIQRGIDALGRGKDFLIVYYGSDAAGGWQTLDRPLRTLTTLDRFGLIRWDGKTPTLRMLQVPELARAMGLADPDTRVPCRFIFNHGTRRDKIKLLGNGVCAPVMAAVVQTLTGAGADSIPLMAAE